MTIDLWYIYAGALALLLAVLAAYRLGFQAGQNQLRAALLTDLSCKKGRRITDAAVADSKIIDATRK